MKATTIVFTGALQPASFLDFAEHRARRLGLAMSVNRTGLASVTIAVAGQDDLIDAFEMACSLGPIDCIVRNVRRLGEPR